GIYVYDHNGKRYLDCSGGWGVALLGHRHSNVTQAMIQQLSRIMTSPINHRNSTREEFVDFLLSLVPSPLNRVFLSNSGTEAVEAALKFAIYTTGRSKIVSHVKGFHGRTLGSLSVTHNPYFRRPFEDLLNPDRITFIPLNNLELARKSISNETAAVIIEAIQGEGGVNQASDEYLQGLREICNHTGTLLIIDEIQTGLGRTGNLFAFEKSGIVPDILCLAKGLGGGFPIGATIVSEKVDVAYGMHGSTFGGNPMACAAGLATLQTLVSDGLIENAQIQGDNLLRRLKELSREFPLIREIRGRGLMIAIVLRRSHKTLLGHLLDKGILSIPTGRNIIRLLPPLTISSAEIDQIVCGLRNALLKTNDKVFKRT
ncbi:MAG: aspartate aminotransferase family protein, partial [Methanobacteriota archaeon]